MRTWRRLLTIGVMGIAGWAGAESRALANGRYPLANQLVIDPRSSAHMVARATFGILATTDGGKNWTWICEDAIGYFGLEDPPIAVFADGSTVVASSKSLSVSRDGGCSWVRATGAAGSRFGVDVAVDPINPQRALAIESAPIDGAYSVFLVQTMDDGASWSDVGPTLGGEVLVETVEVAPSNPDRVYVSGRMRSLEQSALLRSDDAGQSWTRLPVNAPSAVSAYIGAVDPRDANVVYVRARSSVDTSGFALVSRDAGASWTQVWSGPGDVAGFALSADGAILAVGGPIAGIHVANTSDMVFRKTSSVGASCLTFSGTALLACAKEAIDQFSIGVSEDLGAHFTPLLHFHAITPRDCASSSSAAVCGGIWPWIAPSLGIDAGAPATGGGASGAQPEPGPGGGSGCSLSSASPHTPPWWLGLVLWLAGTRRRRSERKPRHPATDCA